MNMRVYFALVLVVSSQITAATCAAPEMAPCPLEYRGEPLRSIYADDGHVYALYGKRDYGREWVALTSDSLVRLRMTCNSTVLSPSRDRYFYVAVVPGFEGLRHAMSPNYDDALDPTLGMDAYRGWANNSVAMHLCVHLLSGQLVTSIPLAKSYWGDYDKGGWPGNHWVCLQARTGKSGGNFYSLFVNVDSGEKHLVGWPIYDQTATADGRFLAFTYGGLLFVNFRAVYPLLDEPLPDFGSEAGWKIYKEKYFVRKEQRPWERSGGRFVRGFELLPDGRKAVVLLRTPAHDPPSKNDEITTPPQDLAAPEVVAIDLDKLKTAKDPGQYATPLAVLPKAIRPRLAVDRNKQEMSVTDQTGRILWRKSFAELAAP